MKKLQKKILLFTAISLPVILSLPMSIVGLSLQSIANKETIEVKSQEMSERLNRSLAKREIEWKIDPKTTVASNLWSYPTPRYSPIELFNVHHYTDGYSMKEYLDLISDKGWGNWKEVDGYEARPYLGYPGYLTHSREYYEEWQYQLNNILNKDRKTGFLVEFLSNGNFKITNWGFDKGKYGNGGKRKIDRIWLDPTYASFEPYKWGSGCEGEFGGVANTWQDSNNQKFYTGISYLKNNKNNISHENTYYSKGSNVKNNLTKQSGSGTLSYNTEHSLANDGNTILLVKSTENAFSHYGHRYYQVFHGDWFGSSDYGGLLDNNATHYSLQTNTGVYDFRPVTTNSGSPTIYAYGGAFLSGTGRNYVGYSNQCNDVFNTGIKIQSNMLVNAAGMSLNDAQRHNLADFNCFSAKSDIGNSSNWRVWSTHSSVTPVWYSPKEHKWYYLTDDILFLNSIPINLEIKNDKKNAIKDMWPSDFVNGLQAGQYNKWIDYRTTLSQDQYWTTPSSWWQYYPTYIIKSNNLNGTVTVDIYIPTYSNQTHSITQIDGFRSMDSSMYNFDTTYMRHKQIVINGFKDGVTTFTDYNNLNFLEELKYLASNFVNISTDEMRRFFIDNIDRFLNKSELLHLENDDINIQVISNDLRSGTCQIRVKLREYVNSNFQHIENSNNGIYKDFLSTQSYRIEGRTQLNRNIITVPEQYKNVSPTDNTITTDFVKNLIINEQENGVKRTIATNYTDKSKEVFSNYGNLLKFENNILSITSMIPNQKTGTIQVNYKLAKIYDTDIDNHNICNQSLEGSIILKGFKGCSSTLYDFNSTTPYADKFGTVGWDGNTNSTVITNKSQKTQNVSANNEIILSQQFINSSNARAALIYDENRPDKIIIRTYQGNTIKQEYIFDAPTTRVKVASVDDTPIYTNSKTQLLESFSSFQLCNANGNRISNSEWMSGKFLSGNLGGVADAKESYKVTMDIYANVPLSSTLAFNKMIPFSSNDNQKSDTMLIFNAGSFAGINGRVNKKVVPPMAIVDLSKQQPTIKFIEVNGGNNQNVTNSIYAASAYVKFDGNQKKYYISYIGYDENEKTNFVTITLDQNLNVTNYQAREITQTLNLRSSNGVSQISTSSNIYQFKTTVENNKVKMISLLNNPTNNFSNMTRSFYTSDDVFKNGIKKIKITTPSGSSLEEMKANIPLDQYETVTNAFYNWNYSRNMDALYAVYKNDKTYGIKIDLNKLINKTNITSISSSDTEVITNSSIGLDDFIYPLQDNNDIVYIGYSETDKQNISVETQLINGEYVIDNRYTNNDISTIDANTLKNMIPAQSLSEMFENYSPDIFNNGQYSFTNLNYDIVNGTIYAQLLLQKNTSANFTENEKAFLIKITGFKRNNQTTTIRLNSAGVNYFKNVTIDNFETQLMNLARNKQLNQYFEISNHNSTIIDDALNSTSGNFENGILINYDIKNGTATVGFNIVNLIIENNGVNQYLSNGVVYVDIPLNIPSFVNDGMTLPYTQINATANLTPSQFANKVINNPNGSEANKLKEVIANNTGLPTISKEDISISLDMSYNNGLGELNGTFSIPTLTKYTDKFNNIQFTVNGMKQIESTIVQKREDYYTNIMPSKLQSYLDADVNYRSLQFIQIGGTKLPDTRVVAAYVNEFDDTAGTATVTFSIVNFIDSESQSNSSNSTLNATFEFTNLRGTSIESLTTIDAAIETNDTNIVAQDFVEKVEQNNNVAINLLTEKNAIKNAAENTQIEVSSISYDNKNGIVNILWKLDRYIANSGDVINQPIMFKSQITGFNKVNGPTSVTLKDNISTYDYEYLINAIQQDINFIRNIINIENEPANTQLSLSKIVEGDNSTDLYVQLDKYYADDELYSINNGYEVKLIINKSDAYAISFHLDHAEITSNEMIPNNDFLKNNWYIFAIVGGILSLVIAGGIGYWMYKNKLKSINI